MTIMSEDIKAAQQQDTAIKEVKVRVRIHIIKTKKNGIQMKPIKETNVKKQGECCTSGTS